MAEKKTKAQKQPKTPKGDPNKQFDVMIHVVHDNRAGQCRSIETTRLSFATEEEAVAFANKLKGVQ